MSESNFQWIIQALGTISRQAAHCENKLDLLLQKCYIPLPPELIKAGEDLAAKTKALQAALDAQASQPTQKEPIL
jgi:hypothetical protein